MRRAMAISESVPQPPPIAITALAARTISALRISPIPVASATSMSGFASRGSFPGRMPTVSPPACFAPRAAADITPPSPPHSSTAPRSDAPPRDRLYLVRAALLDRYSGPVGERPIDGRGGRGAVERHAVMQREHGQRVRADLVGEVAVRRDAVGADDHEVHLRLAH